MNTKLFIFSIALVALGLRLFNIEQKNLWFDEVYSWKISQGNLVQILSQTSGDIHPPLYYIVLKLWMIFFSDSIISMRSLSALLGVISIYFIYKISKMFLNNDLKIFFVLMLYTFSPLNIYYSQEVRMFNLNLFLCLGSVFYYFRFINTPSNKLGLLYLIFTILALYTHYFAFFILFTEVFILLTYFFNKNVSLVIIKKYLFYFFLINFFYVPWYPVLYNQVKKGQPWRTEQTFIQVIISEINYFKEIFLSTYYIYEGWVIYYFSSFFGLFIIIYIFFSLFKILNSKTFFANKSNEIILFVLIPLLLATIISINQSITFSRYLSITIPYLFITLIYFLFKFNKYKTAILISIFLLGVSCYGVYINFDNDFKNNDYREIISYLEENYNSGDEILVEPHFMQWGIEYYINHNNSNLKHPKILGWNLNMQVDSLMKTPDIKNVWFVVDYSSLEKNNYGFLDDILKPAGFKKVKAKSFYIVPAKVKVEYYKKD